MPLRRDALAEPWRGVNIGGWLLLEPGPSSPLFAEQLLPGKKEARCEWDFMMALRKAKGKKASDVIKRHRDTHITKKDFECIRSSGLNAVRLPIGYWCVTGPSAGEPYEGPALEYVDRAVQWAEACGLQLVLDLHGCPGGESGEAPCGRRQRPHGTWHHSQWRIEETLQTLEVLVERYRKCKCVTGIAVCNEPANSIPASKLCRYYDKAVKLIRSGGMPASRVSILLPIFQRCENEFAKQWLSFTDGKHRNVCFDVHCYQCFENDMNGKTLAQHMRHMDENREMLRRYPMVVGEWSLALGCAAWSTCGTMSEDEVYHLLGLAQLDAFKDASHGSFFWNWCERDTSPEWNYQVAWRRGLLTGAPRQLPQWVGGGEDPLEEELHPAPADPHVQWGEPVFLRTFHGRYIDVEGTKVKARWPDKGDWQEFKFVPVADRLGKDIAHRSPRHGDVVRLQAHSGNLLAVSEREAQVVASRRLSGANVEFVLHFHYQDSLHLAHRAVVYLQSRATSRVLNADEEADSLFAHYTDRGWWQQLAVEKKPLAEDDAEEELVTPLKKIIMDAAELDTCSTPLKASASKRRSVRSSISVCGSGADLLSPPAKRIRARG
mmetsp:Transcript_55302/g.103937  ORF Transcript_55302/g.103937 Transcript_55302/m.103937 type:complete len:605 (+) Transcript_55302:60-1874(+)